MNISSETSVKAERAFVPTTALATHATCNDEFLVVTLTDGRVLHVPLAWFPRLRDATSELRSQVEVGGGGVSLHWSDLDEVLSLAGLMAGVDTK